MQWPPAGVPRQRAKRLRMAAERAVPEAATGLHHSRAAGRAALTPCTTMPWLTVSGNSTACTTSQGTPEASSCDIQNAGLPGLLQLTTDRLLLNSGEDCTVGNVALNAYLHAAAVAVAAVAVAAAGCGLGRRLLCFCKLLQRTSHPAHSSGRRRLNSAGASTASSHTSSCWAMVAAAAAACMPWWGR